MRRVFHPETNGVKASPHRLKWMLSRGALAAPSDPWNFDASDVPPRQNGLLRLRAIHGPHFSVHRTLLGLWDRHRRVATGLASGGMPAALHVTDDTARHLRYTSRAKREADVSLSHRCTMEHHDATGVSPRDKRCELVRTGINGRSAHGAPAPLTHGISTRRPFHPANLRSRAQGEGCVGA